MTRHRVGERGMTGEWGLRSLGMTAVGWDDGGGGGVVEDSTGAAGQVARREGSFVRGLVFAGAAVGVEG